VAATTAEATSATRLANHGAAAATTDATTAAAT
jgi:hypothetical protein